jgi:hypothetical protein
MAWAIFVLVVVLIVIALLRCNLTALSEPGRFETRTANMTKRCFHPRASRQGADDGRAQRPPGQWMHPRAADLTSKECRATPTRSCFGSPRMESASGECRLSVTSRPQIMFGIS